MLATIPRPRLFAKIRLASLYALGERCSTSFLTPSPYPACSKHEWLIITRITSGIGWGDVSQRSSNGTGEHRLMAPPSRESHFFRRSHGDQIISVAPTQGWERVGYRLGLKMELRYDATIITTYFQAYIAGKMPFEKFLEVSTFSWYIFF